MVSSTVTEVPTARLSEGATLTVEIDVPKRESAPRLAVLAISVDGPIIRRSLSSRGEASVLLRGLGAGTFRVRVGSVKSLAEGADFEVELDGADGAVIHFVPD